MDIGKQIAAYAKPILAGRIDEGMCGYSFSEGGYTNPQGVHFSSFKDDRGRVVSLSKKNRVACPDVATHPGAPLVRGRVFVSSAMCASCAHRLPRKCCAILREKARESLRQEPAS